MAGFSEKRHVVLGVTGSIAAYKSIELARILVSRGYEVRAIMTKSAEQFIGAATLEAVTGHPVYSDFWQDSSNESIKHISLADWCDALVIAPATADILAKMSCGCADTPLLAVRLATKAPVLVAPAMNTNMYENAITQDNLARLAKSGVKIIEPDKGLLACGKSGNGRLAEPWEIFFEIRRALSRADYAGKRVLITTGPTREALDPVRFISNRSSGKMGVELARDAFRRGATVTLIHGPLEVRVPREVMRVPVISAADMYAAVMKHTFEVEQPPDVVIMAAAVADFRPAQISPHKIKKVAHGCELALEATADILAELGRRRNGLRPLLIGFAVETGELDDLLNEARKKLTQKKVDMIVGNFASDALEQETNRVWLVDRGGKETQIATTFKSRIAGKILDKICRLV
ncbi:MAG: bifunctional phosphopantothenoylcysteine decarboxylase/phosphopantothenate--cysteine ligase CoaBC [Deltaproteobacteria bacterium]|nr:bifunctional phosphopantothenoylcysteine decarboxylase/phosphopantothenate--cysteine ligase CoaBC [Deltaproteobacteria bacterium]